ncbi:MAG: hypothetical protein LBF21_00795, partial [Puniceicoccales bacterium]|nr:hypothetical protein [Puniceicoccales bacterium]
YGDFEITYNAALLENLRHFIEMFWVHHLVRFYESLKELNQAQAGTGDEGGPFDGGGGAALGGAA